ncbi:MAG: FAD-binding protein [Deltaproteobacteria bacterium]|nr:FAD-binding protein [Deltaproteobacteria bacterium]
MYPESMQESIRKVEASRARRIELALSGKPVVEPMSAEQRQDVLDRFHPDYQDDARREVRWGPNAGQRLTTEVADLLETYARVDPSDYDLLEPDFDTDVLVIGAGSAGFCAALLAQEHGARVTLATKLRLGDANSMMAQGGIQAAVRDDDSPVHHYLDVVGGGHFDNRPELARALVSEAPDAIAWLRRKGVMFDQEDDGSLKAKPGGGTCRPRMLSARDYTGAAICRTLRDEIQNRPEIRVLEHSSAIELIKDARGRVAGAVLYHLLTREHFTIRARATVMATGGFGRLHVKGFETTNHYGATADGLVMAYRAGARLLYMDSVQYHPTGAVFPPQILGFLCTEKLRGMGGQPVNADGELFVYPLEPRDVEAASFIREATELGHGVSTPSGHVGIWLDTPVIEKLNGAGAIEKNLPAMLRQFQRFGVDIRSEPILVYPTLHYQNGGIEIDVECRSTVEGLYAAGEVAGGIHGRNRLMGNSQLDLIVFGRRAGRYAAAFAGTAEPAELSLGHVLEANRRVGELGVDRDRISPLVLPDYVPERVKRRQHDTRYRGTLI